MVPSFFFTNNTGAPHGDKLSHINPLSTKSCSWVFNSFSSAGAILYGGIEMGVEPDNNSILNSNSQSGGKLDKSSRNSSRNSCTIGTLSKFTFEEDLSITCAK